MAQQIPEQITGSETATEGTPLSALIGFYRAFNARDLMLMERNWDISPDASMSNPLGGLRRGWPEIRGTYARIFASREPVRVAFHDWTLHEFGDAFVAVGRESGQAGDLSLAIRTTRIYRRTAEGWRQFHHHGSFEDPALFAAYQARINGSHRTA